MDVVVNYDPEGATEGLLALYSTYEWWADRTTEGVRRALDHTDALVTLRDRETGTVAAAARVLTDDTYYAMVYDVIVVEGRRDEGLGRQLLEAIIDHPELAEIGGISLLSREGLIPFYESCGFAVADDAVAHPDGSPEPLRWLRYRRG